MGIPRKTIGRSRAGAARRLLTVRKAMQYTAPGAEGILPRGVQGRSLGRVYPGNGLEVGERPPVSGKTRSDMGVGTLPLPKPRTPGPSPSPHAKSGFRSFSTLSHSGGLP